MTVKNIGCVEQIRINLPLFLHAFIPVENLGHFNRLIQGDTASDRKNVL